MSATTTTPISTPISTPMTTPELAEVLFASTLQESDHPTPAAVRAVVGGILARDRGAGDCVAHVAQEAGDHPDSYVARMHWALHAVRVAYQEPTRHAVAA